LSTVVLARPGRSDGIFYDSQTLGGVALHVSTSPELRTGDLNRPVGAALTYNQGPIVAMLAHEKNSAGNTDTFVGLKWTISGISLMGVYDKSEAGASVAKAVTLGAQYTIGLTTLNGGWGKVDVDGVRAEEVASVGAVYALSKRSSVYADLANKKFPSGSMTVYGVGVSHSF
jgi:predicted porin